MYQISLLKNEVDQQFQGKKFVLLSLLLIEQSVNQLWFMFECSRADHKKRRQSPATLEHSNLGRDMDTGGNYHMHIL